MSAIGIIWGGGDGDSVVDSAIKEAGLEVIDLSWDGDLQPGLQEFSKVHSVNKVRYLADSAGDRTSNSLFLEIADAIASNRPSCIWKLAKILEGKVVAGPVFLFFACDWADRIQIDYFEGSSCELAFYMKLNTGAFRRQYVVRARKYNLDLGTPLVWRLSP
jgi:hypothetical protein